MRPGFRQAMALLHSWTGLLPGWIVFIVFLFGTAAFFQNEISLWMRPELTHAPASRAALIAADRVLREKANGAGSWSVSLPGARGGEGVVVSWRAVGAGRREATEITLDPASGQAIDIRETRGGFFLYRFHFDLHAMPVAWARYIVSLAAAAMLVALISGVVTHKKIFVDFFLLRLGKGQRSWLDAHNVTGVLALPFFVMITYTGLVTLMFMSMPWAVAANYPTEDDFYADWYPEPSVSSGPSGSAPVLSLVALHDQAARIWGVGPSYLTIENPGQRAATATLYPARERWGDPSDSLALDAVTGKPIAHSTNPGAASRTRDVMVDLHRGWFSTPILRWLYFLSGVAGTVMIATGLVLWTVKRRIKLADPARPYLGFWLIERLNVGVLVGATAGMAAYFLANRLIGPGVSHRADWEINALFGMWGAVLLWGALRPARRAWIETLWVCAAAYALVPLVNGLTTSRGLVQSLASGDWVFAGFDLTMLAVAALSAFAARKTANHKPAPRRQRQLPQQDGS